MAIIVRHRTGLRRNAGVEQGFAQPMQAASPIAIIDDARQRMVVAEPDDVLCDAKKVEPKPMRHAASAAVEWDFAQRRRVLLASGIGSMRHTKTIGREPDPVS